MNRIKLLSLWCFIELRLISRYYDNKFIKVVYNTVSLLDKWIQLIKIQPIEYYIKKFHSYKMEFNENIKRYKI